MRDAMEHVVGKQPLVEVLDVQDNGNLEMVSTTIKSKVRACDVGQGVLILADMFGGTPSNIAMGCLLTNRVEVISGFNLPLLIKAATVRKTEKNLTSLAQHVLEAGRQYMCISANKIDEQSSSGINSDA
jgi:PTS system mannose-specific IIA component